MTKKMGMRCYVTGRVQGVWFRASTQTVANKHQLSGWASNLADGRVEVVAFGDEDKIAILRKWLHQGPPLAKVTDIIIEEIPWEERVNFEIR